jgi:hypothetical protein
MDAKLLQIAIALKALPESIRIELAREILPVTHVPVPRRCSSAMQKAFLMAASRFHKGLRAELRFNPVVTMHCWKAMVDTGQWETSDAEPGSGSESPSAAATQPTLVLEPA